MAIVVESQIRTLPVINPEIRKRKRLTEGVVTGLLMNIVSGTYQPGDMLPAEAEIGGEYDVSRTVVREAVKIVEDKGLISVVQGRGSTVLPREDWNALDADIIARQMAQPDSQQVFEEAHRRAHGAGVRDGRTGSQTADAGIGGAHADGARSGSGAGGQPDRYLEYDYEFHHLITEASGNRIARGIMVSLEGPLRASRQLTSQLAGAFESAQPFHRSIFEAIVAGDSDLARKTMRQHLLESRRMSRPTSSLGAPRTWVSLGRRTAGREFWVMERFKGVLVAIATPMDASGRLDEPAFRVHVDALIDAGVHGIVPGGSPGEVMTLNADEYQRLIALAVEQVAGRVSVVAGCSANATHQVIANCRAAEDAGADGLMVTDPFYSIRPSRAPPRTTTTSVAASSSPIVVDDNPGTTGVDASPELLGLLSQNPHIEYVKESSGDASRVTRILEATGGRMTVLSGTDHMALDHFSTGAQGWVSASANVLAAQCVALYRLAIEDADLQAARDLYREMHPFLTYSEVSGHGIQAIKAAMVFVDRPLGEPRPPLRAVSPQTLAEVKPMVERALRAPLPAAANQG